jgi:hypothetical protein
MISEEGYWEAKKKIAALEQGYAMQAMKCGSSSSNARNFWGYCDGMKQCLKILETCVEQKPEKSEE